MSNKTSKKDILANALLLALFFAVIGLWAYASSLDAIGQNVIIISKIIGVNSESRLGFAEITLQNGTSIFFYGRLPDKFAIDDTYKITLFQNQYGDFSLVNMYKIEGDA